MRLDDIEKGDDLSLNTMLFQETLPAELQQPHPPVYNASEWLNRSTDTTECPKMVTPSLFTDNVLVPSPPPKFSSNSPWDLWEGETDAATAETSSDDDGIYYQPIYEPRDFVANRNGDDVGSSGFYHYSSFSGMARLL
jgi:hypothetical protein